MPIAQDQTAIASVDGRGCRIVGVGRERLPGALDGPPLFGGFLDFLGAEPYELPGYPRVFDRDYEPMRPETRAALAATFAEPNRRLEALLGRTFGWS